MATLSEIKKEIKRVGKPEKRSKKPANGKLTDKQILDQVKKITTGNHRGYHV